MVTGIPVHVRTLLCQRDVELAIRSLSSLVRCSVDPVKLVIHEDGSLTPADRSRLEGEFAGIRVVGRKQADEIMSEKLRSHPHARQFREDSVWGLKLLDVALLEKGDCFYVDGDLRFFRRFSGLFREDAAHGRSVFLKDTVWQAYSVRPWHLRDRRKLRVAAGINTGLTLIDEKLFDLDFVEWFLAQPDWRVIPAWTEPTCWAALALRANGHVVSPRQITNLYPSAKVTRETIGGHFLSAHRGPWQAQLEAPIDETANATGLILEPVSEIGALGLGINQCKRKLQNTLGHKVWRP